MCSAASPRPVAVVPAETFSSSIRIDVARCRIRAISGPNLRSHLPIGVSKGAKPPWLRGESTLSRAGGSHRLREPLDGINQLGVPIARKPEANVRRRLPIEEESVAGIEEDALCRC